MEQPEQNESRLLLFLQRHKDARRRPPASEHENRHAVTYFFFVLTGSHSELKELQQS